MEKYRQAYKEYMMSDEWRRKREEIYKKKKGVCQICNKKLGNSYHVHHKNYKHLGKELEGDLMLLCEQCHMKIHHREKSKSDKIILPGSLLISNEFMNLSLTAKIMYIYMKMWAGDKEKFYYSYSLARKIFVSNSTVCKNIRELEKNKFIKIEKTTKGNLYTLLK